VRVRGPTADPQRQQAGGLSAAALERERCEKGNEGCRHRTMSRVGGEKTKKLGTQKEF